MASKLLLVTLFGLIGYLVTPTTAKLTSDDKAELIQAHNFYRAKTTPTPTNMVALEWDDELAALAQFWAVTCILEPNENRHEQSEDYDYVGEILHGSGNSSINLTSMVFEWFFDGRNYDYTLASCVDEDGEAQDDAEDCERYIQLVWAQTYKMGCGAYRCEELMDLDEELEDGQSALMVVCNYGPGGGFTGVQPYTSGGQACSKCPSGYEECNKSLCTQSSAPELVSQISMATSLVMFAVLSVSL